MHSERDRQAWRDIVTNSRLGLSFVDNVDVQSFGDDPMRYYATVRCLEIVSEAARKLSPEARAAVDQPWRDIMGSGNVYRHDYNALTPTRIFDTATNRLPPLLAAAEAALES
jgi:uncharacterized protein with HEPN domain